ncbi:MAG: bifunctional folylpolyglutamate synthase/dihydrofolate synthase [Flavisolibacter sp.]
MFSHVGSSAYKKDLTNTIALCDQLGNPQKKFKSIHVAGTNGKGSVSHMLASIYQTAGFKTGLYTSPHLYDFRERIRIDGMMADENFVVDFVGKMKPLIEKIEPSFFEITVAMAFEYFALHKVDIAIIETGLGGRLDSTNVIDPIVSIITNIGWDHMNLLGNTLEKIAFEKAGIIKYGVPVIVGERNPFTDKVFEEQAFKKNAPLFFAEDHYSAENFILKKDSIDIEVYSVDENVKHNLKIDLPGIYQSKNILTVLQALSVLNDRNIQQDIIEKALKDVKRLTGLFGRWEMIHHNPIVVLEVAHNTEGVTQMLRHLSFLKYRQVHFIIGMVKDKDVDHVLELFPQNASYYFTQAHIPRAMDAEVLQEKAKGFSLNGNVWHDVNDALAAAMKNAVAEDIIIICGSIFLVAEVERNLESNHGDTVTQ